MQLAWINELDSSLAIPADAATLGVAVVWSQN